MKRRLADDLNHISKFSGYFTWDIEARDFLIDWHSKGMKPAPQDPRLQHYSTRRLVHVSKLALIISASKREDMEIILEDIEEAKRLLLEAEVSMPRAIDPIGSNPLRDAMVMVRKYIILRYNKTNKPVMEHELRNLLISEVHPMHVPTLLQEIANARWVTAIGDAPVRKFTPNTEE